MSKPENVVEPETTEPLAPVEAPAETTATNIMVVYKSPGQWAARELRKVDVVAIAGDHATTSKMPLVWSADNMNRLNI